VECSLEEGIKSQPTREPWLLKERGEEKSGVLSYNAGRKGLPANMDRGVILPTWVSIKQKTGREAFR
jgi:hypothetical protein